MLIDKALQMRMTGVGQASFAIGLAGLGVLSLISGDYALNLQPVPAWVPWREILARISGLMLLGGGVGILFKPTARLSALVLTAKMVIWLLLFRLPRVIANPLSEGTWLGFSETLLVTGGWMFLASVTIQENNPTVKWFVSAEGWRVARILFGIALPLIGLSHLVYLQETTALVSAWLPYRTGWAVLGGAGHIAAGVGVSWGSCREWRRRSKQA